MISITEHTIIFFIRAHEIHFFRLDFNLILQSKGIEDTAKKSLFTNKYFQRQQTQAGIWTYYNKSKVTGLANRIKGFEDSLIRLCYFSGGSGSNHDFLISFQALVRSGSGVLKKLALNPDPK